MDYLRLAFDRASVRSYDVDGRLHIEVAHISKSNVCPYLGREIPNSEAMGLDPNKVYKLFRDPEELERAAPTSNNIQLLIKHVAVNASDPKKDLTVGSTGTDAEWNAPYLDNSLVIWDKEAIEGIESNAQKELSAGYYYTADMTPGSFEGEAYDGVMRNIRFNHVALVVEGRAGSDVVVGDSMENVKMKRKTLLSRTAVMANLAIAGCLKPCLAQDAQLDLSSVLSGVTQKNWKESKEKLRGFIQALPVKKFKDKPAMDAGIRDVMKLLDSLEDAGPDGNKKENDMADDKTGKDSPADAIRKLLEGKISDEDMEKVLQLVSGPDAEDDADGDNDVEEFVANILRAMKSGSNPSGQDSDDGVAPGTSTEVGKGTLENKQQIVPEGGSAPEKGTAMDKAAMDAAIKEAEDRAVQRVRDIAEAEKAVEPFIGKVTVAMDSAEAVYRLALDSAKVNVEGVHPSAFKAMVAMLQKPGEKKALETKQAHDGALKDASTSVQERFKVSAPRRL